MAMPPQEPMPIVPIRLVKDVFGDASASQFHLVCLDDVGRPLALRASRDALSSLYHAVLTTLRKLRAAESPNGTEDSRLAVVAAEEVAGFKTAASPDMNLVVVSFDLDGKEMTVALSGPRSAELRAALLMAENVLQPANNQELPS